MLQFPKLLNYQRKHNHGRRGRGGREQKGAGNSDEQRGSWTSWDSVGAHHHAVSAHGGVSEVECVTETQEAWAMAPK